MNEEGRWVRCYVGDGVEVGGEGGESVKWNGVSSDEWIGL